MEGHLRVVISGGGTGGHIFPAIAIANAIRALRPDAQFLFIGARDRMEMQRVPQAGYDIKGLPVRGLVRPLYSLKNISVMADYLRSKWMARRILRQFRPNVAVGVGGYASAAALDAAHALGVPCLIQEQNSYAGKTNTMLAKKAQVICVAYDGMERFFPKEKIIKTGNPVRQNVVDATITPAEARKAFGLQPDKKTLLFVGGSLGARTINESLCRHLDRMAAVKDEVQFIWQTGRLYHDEMASALKAAGSPENVKLLDFISDMGAAYRAADLVASRAGASSISEFCLIGKPVILVPSPNVAEDHQTKNAMALVNRDAAIYVKDAEAPDTLLDRALQTVGDDAKLAALAKNIKTLAVPNSADIIAKEALKLAEAQA